MMPSKRMQQLAAILAVTAAVVRPAFCATRSLKQDALSNSNGCLETMPKCEAGACAIRNTLGSAKWVCLRCSGNYEPVIDASGQDNIVQCVCPRGHYEASPSATSCSRCPSNMFCPGGDRVENPVSRGLAIQCGSGLVTRNTGARSQTDCVAPAGFAMNSTQPAATACQRSEYAPAFNRLGRCLRCQSGLEESPSSSFVDGQRISKRVVCKVPPGRYMSQGLVRVCPQGFYRATYDDFDASVAQRCLPCNFGISTAGPGATSASNCSRVLPGFGLSQVTNPSDAQQLPVLVQISEGYPNATMCEFGYYSSGVNCIKCPSNTVTRGKGAKSIEECVVPPGYYLLSGSLANCTDGTFREGWLMFSDSRALSCISCGENIPSEPTDLDEHPLVANGSLVRASSSSCYIEDGQGMIATGRNMFAAKDCPVNTYGVAGRVYGWNAAPCKPCPRNMITDSVTRANSSDACMNDDGFGYASEGASRCAPGFYSAKGSRKPCHQCPAGRTTPFSALQQRVITDCVVLPGFGVVNSTDNSTDAFNPNTTGYTDARLVLLPALECPVGYYGPGNSAGAECIACPFGSSTAGPGSTSSSDCSVCIAGYGQATVTSPCAECPYGSFQPGGLSSCEACPSTSFHNPVIAGTSPNYVSSGTTLYLGSHSQEACVPQQSQMSPEAGQAFFSSATTVSLITSAATTISTCLTACPTSSCCFAQLDTTGCKLATLAPGSSSAAGSQFVYKLPPSSLGSAASVRAKMLSSGFYAHCTLPTASDVDAWFTVGSNLTTDAHTFNNRGAAAGWHAALSKADCKKRCDDSNVCIGFVASVSGGSLQCSYRGGIDTLSSVAFFALPVAGPSLDLHSLGW